MEFRISGRWEFTRMASCVSAVVPAIEKPMKSTTCLNEFRRPGLGQSFAACHKTDLRPFLLHQPDTLRRGPCGARILPIPRERPSRLPSDRGEASGNPPWPCPGTPNRSLLPGYTFCTGADNGSSAQSARRKSFPLFLPVHRLKIFSIIVFRVFRKVCPTLPSSACGNGERHREQKGTAPHLVLKKTTPGLIPRPKVDESLFLLFCGLDHVEKEKIRRARNRSRTVI